MKAIKVTGGYAIKRKARIEHECHDCARCIEPGEEYYQLSLEYFYQCSHSESTHTEYIRFPKAVVLWFL